jgi:hypothetical protein
MVIMVLRGREGNFGYFVEEMRWMVHGFGQRSMAVVIEAVKW